MLEMGINEMFLTYTVVTITTIASKKKIKYIFITKHFYISPEEWFFMVNDTLISLIIFINKQYLPL